MLQVYKKSNENAKIISCFYLTLSSHRNVYLSLLCMELHHGWKTSYDFPAMVQYCYHITANKKSR